MSRMGKIPIVPPPGVTVTVNDRGRISVKGPNGELSVNCSSLINVRKDGDKIWVGRANDEKKTRALQGLTHRLITNMITGVTKGYKKELEIIGVGYRAALEGKDLVLLLGFSNPIRYPIAPDVRVKVDKQTIIIVEGIDKQRVGQVAAEIKKFRKPDAYKGKGIRYLGEHVRIKPGKAAVSAGF